MADVAEALESAGVKVRFETVPIDQVHPNPWNPNQMDERTRTATREALATYGLVTVLCTVRPHPDLDGHWQVIDGEHRLTIARDELGYTEAPVGIIDVGDAVARKLTVVLNETKGEPDDVQLGNLLVEIRDMGEDITTALPYDDGHLSHLLDLANSDWGTYNPPADDGPPADGGGDTVALVCRVTLDTARRFAEAEKSIADELDLVDATPERNGQVLEILVARYLERDGG